MEHIQTFSDPLLLTYYMFQDQNRQILPQWNNIVNNEHCVNINNGDNIPKVICKEDVIILENYVIMTAVLKHVQCDISAFPKRYYATGNNFIVRKGIQQIKQISIM